MSRHVNISRAPALPLSIGLILVGGLSVVQVEAGQFYLGPKACADCHGPESQILGKTKHAMSFKDIHRSPKAAPILAAAGGDKNMRKNPTCTQCHFTMEQENASKPATAKSGISCESCHGPASDWIKIHNDYGGPGVTRESEKADHHSKRIADSKKGGMIRPEMKYDIAANCMSCHGLADPGVSGATFGKMMEAGHPFNLDYEIVRYSQGSVRHRFYPPNMAVNAEMPPAELARLFIAGQAAKLVSAAQAVARADHAGYKGAQQKRVVGAVVALSKLKSVPEAATLISAPTEANARKLVAAVEGKDLSNEVKDLLPAKGSYK